MELIKRTRKTLAISLVSLMLASPAYAGGGPLDFLKSIGRAITRTSPISNPAHDLILGSIRPNSRIRISGSGKSQNNYDTELILEAYDKKGQKIAISRNILPHGGAMDFAVNSMEFGCLNGMECGIENIEAIRAVSKDYNLFGAVINNTKDNDNNTKQKVVPGINFNGLNNEKILREYLASSFIPPAHNSMLNIKDKNFLGNKILKNPADILRSIFESGKKANMTLDSAVRLLVQQQNGIITVGPGTVIDVPVYIDYGSPSTIDMTWTPPTGFSYMSFVPGPAASGKTIVTDIGAPDLGDEAGKVIIMAYSLTPKAMSGLFGTMRFQVTSLAQNGSQSLSLYKLSGADVNNFNIPADTMRISLPKFNVHPIVAGTMESNRLMYSGQTKPAGSTMITVNRNTTSTTSTNKWFNRFMTNATMGISNVYTADNEGPTFVLLSGFDSNFIRSDCYIPLGPGETFEALPSTIFPTMQWIAAQSKTPFQAYQKAVIGSYTVKGFVAGKTDTGRWFVDPKPDATNQYVILNPTNQQIIVRVTGHNNLQQIVATSDIILQPGQSATGTPLNLLNITSTAYSPVAAQGTLFIELDNQSNARMVTSVYRQNPSLETLLNIYPTITASAPAVSSTLVSPCPGSNGTVDISSQDAINPTAGELAPFQSLAVAGKSGTTPDYVRFSDRITVGFDYNYPLDEASDFYFKLGQRSRNYTITYTFPNDSSLRKNPNDSSKLEQEITIPDGDWYVTVQARKIENGNELVSSYPNEVLVRNFSYGVLTTSGNTSPEAVDLATFIAVINGKMSFPSGTSMGTFDLNYNGKLDPADITAFINRRMGK